MKVNSTKSKKGNPLEPAVESNLSESVAENQLPDPPYIPQDITFPVPKITQAEIIAYSNARLCFLTARADYEQKRASLTLKLIQHCHPEPGAHIARLENDGEKLVVLEHCQCCHSSVDDFQQCAHCHTWVE